MNGVVNQSISRVDTGPEFIPQSLADWAGHHDVKIKFIEKGKSLQNGYIERFNKTYREEVLDNYSFDNLKQTRVLTQSLDMDLQQ